MQMTKKKKKKKKERERERVCMCFTLHVLLRHFESVVTQNFPKLSYRKY